MTCLTHSDAMDIVAVLTVIDGCGNLTSKKRKLSTNREIVIGRAMQKCHWSLEDPHMSQKHLHIYVTEGNHVDEPSVWVKDLSRNGFHWNGTLIGRKNDAILLTHGDVLRLSSKTSIIFQTPLPEQVDHFDLKQEQEMRTFCDRYVISDRLIGEGPSSKVFLALNSAARAQLVCKIIDLKGPTAPVSAYQDLTTESHPRVAGNSTVKKKLTDLLRAVDLSRSVQHPNIVQTSSVFASDNRLYIFEEFLAGGDLKEFVTRKRNSLLEVEVAVVVRQILLALKVLHEHGIAHRALNIRNIRLSCSADTARVVLTNFRSAKKLTNHHNAVNGRNLDMIALGEITAFLLSAIPDACRSYNGPPTDLSAASPRARDFVQRLCSTKHVCSLPASEALQHPWFSKDEHKIDLEELYRKSTATWQPTVSSHSSVELVEGFSTNIAELPCFNVFKINSPLRKRSYRQERPVEPHYKPFYRTVADLVSCDRSWKRKKSWDDLQDQVTAANELWQDSSPASSSDTEQRMQQRDAASTSIVEAPIPDSVVPQRKRARTNQNPLSELQNLTLEPPARFIRSQSFKFDHHYPAGLLLGNESPRTMLQPSLGSTESTTFSPNKSSTATASVQTSKYENAEPSSDGVTLRPWKTSLRSLSRLKTPTRDTSPSLPTFVRRRGSVYDVSESV